MAKKKITVNMCVHRVLIILFSVSLYNLYMEVLTVIKTVGSFCIFIVCWQLKMFTQGLNLFDQELLVTSLL